MNQGATFKKLPHGWAVAKLSDLFNAPKSQIVDGPFGSNLKASEYIDIGVPILRIQNIDRNRLVKKNLKYISEEKADELARHAYQADDIILTKLGVPLGKACLVPTDIQPGIIVADLVKLRLTHDNIDKKWLVYAINSPEIANQLKLLTKGSTRPRVNLLHIRSLYVEIPPLPEQHRIVVKIEQLFSELDKGVAELKKARETLALYRQSLLKAAFEGRLTGKWRKEHAGELESADQLLARIKSEREKRYQQQVEEWKQAVKDWEAQGKPGRIPIKPRKPKELQQLSKVELAALPKLPEGWLYTYLAYMGDLSRGKSKHRPRNDPKLFGGPYPFIQTGEVKANQIIDSYTATYNDYGLRQSKLWPKGTLCITIAANIAETAYLGIDACFPDSIVGFTNFGSIYHSKYIDFFIKAVREKIKEFAPATAQKNINLQILEELIVPYCSPTEQKVIIHHLSQNEENINRFIETIDSALSQSNLIRQSILKKAFSGTLVPQDPNDEPASELLKRIKAERDEAAKKKKKQTRKTPNKREKRQMADLLTALKQAGDWISAQEAFRQCGISDGAETDRIEALYLDLRDFVNTGKVIVERRGEQDWLKLQATPEAQSAS